MKKSEKRLLFALLGLLLLGGLFIGFRYYSKTRDELVAQKSALELEWVEIETILEEKEVWDIRGNWLNRNQPAFTTDETISQAIFNDSEARDQEGVSIRQRTLLPVETTDWYVQAGVDVTAQGELDSILRWLYDLTRPSSFRTIRNISIKPDKETPTMVIAKFELLRWYAPPSS